MRLAKACTYGVGTCSEEYEWGIIIVDNVGPFVRVHTVCDNFCKKLDPFQLPIFSRESRWRARLVMYFMKIGHNKNDRVIFNLFWVPLSDFSFPFLAAVVNNMGINGY